MGKKKKGKGSGGLGGYINRALLWLSAAVWCFAACAQLTACASVDPTGDMLIDTAIQVHTNRPFGCVQVIVEGGTVTCCSTGDSTCCATPNHGAECT